MTVYLYGAPNGVLGDITRTDDSTVEPVMLVPTSSVYLQSFGAPVKYTTGGVTQFSGGEAATAFAGVIIREVPSISGFSSVGSGAQNFADGIPNPDMPQGLLKKGYVSVKCAVGTPVRNGTVYVRIVAASPKLIGDFEATADSTNSVALPASVAVWATDGKDTYNNAELRVVST